VLRQHSKLYIDNTLFLESFNNIFIHDLSGLRELEAFRGYEAVLPIDNSSPHIGDAGIAVLADERVRVITFASDTTYIFQVLDVVLFDALKSIVLV
jgi:hypothetical protein